MSEYERLTRNIPWASMGRVTPASRLGRSIVPVGILPFTPSAPPANLDEVPVITKDDPDSEKYLMSIVGTAIQAGDGKLATCAHVVKALFDRKRDGFILARVQRDNAVAYVPYPIQAAVPYLDPRSNELNPAVDLAALIVAAKDTPEFPYEVPVVTWGDSGQVGVGDPVAIAGYPYGEQMFLFTQSNRGVVQPTFYSGIVSAVIPATAHTETRIIQVSIPSAGGMSGGAVFNPKNGEVLGMITSCVHFQGVPQPMSYALPSEIIAPFIRVISFERAG